MNFTFLIGNGFDLNLGLNSGLSSFLDYYLSEGHNNSLSNEIKKDIKTWANLEEQLGKYAGTIKEDDIEAFIEEKEELEASLLRYLVEESKRKLAIDSAGMGEFRDKVIGFFTKLPHEEQEHYNMTQKKIPEAINYSFISFNYTPYLDKIIDRARTINPFSTHSCGTTNYHDFIKDPLHIHGTISEEMILGVNDESQIGSGSVIAKNNLSNYLVKPFINRALGNQNMEQAHTIIDNSRYICVYGMSLGNTDKHWWAYITDWLLKSPDNRLVLFMYDESGRSPIGSKAVRMQEVIRRRFLAAAGKKDEYSKVSQKIIVRFNTDIFTFEHISLEGING